MSIIFNWIWRRLSGLSQTLAHSKPSQLDTVAKFDGHPIQSYLRSEAQRFSPSATNNQNDINRTSYSDTATGLEALLKLVISSTTRCILFGVCFVQVKITQRIRISRKQKESPCIQNHWREINPGATFGGLLISQARKPFAKKHLCDDDRPKPKIWVCRTYRLRDCVSTTAVKALTLLCGETGIPSHGK